ncbi:MAG: zinc-binding dehydrogenase [Candidatus Omnitrophica bacterium]|nr:zinc-binding dehydrogenase [Candidatus Omnitrophota bacterium]
MKAVIFKQHGEPEVLEYTDAPDPVPQPGELLLRVKACSINHLDLWIRQGIPAYRMALPHILGSDVSGVVERVTDGVTHVKPGDAIVLAPGLSCGQCDPCRQGLDNVCVSFGIRGAATDGGYAELVTAKTSDALPLPRGLSFEDAAAYPLVFLAAWHMLVGRAKLTAGERVLIHAAGSGIGHAAIQIAKHLSATVYATVGSDEKIDKARAVGADAVINYQRESVEERVKALTGGEGVHVVFEHVGPQTWEASLRVLAKGGRLVTCGATTGPTVPLDLRYVFSRQLSIFGSMMGTRAELQQVTQLIEQGALRPIIDTVFPLRNARQAHERLLRRTVFGKLVLVP